MILPEHAQKLQIRRFRNSSRELGKNHSRVSEQAIQSFDPPPITTGAQVVDENRGVEDPTIYVLLSIVAATTALKRCATQSEVATQISRGTLPWNPTLAHRTRKDGAPFVRGWAGITV
jgi:hypothetical protein